MRGTTLIDVLLYIALFGILLTGCITSLVSIQESAVRIGASAQITDEANLLLRTLRHAVHTAPVITLPLPGEAGDVLAISTVSGMHYFDSKDGSLNFSNERNSISLTSESIEVHGLSFARAPFLDDEPSPITVIFNLSLRTATGAMVTESFAESMYSPIDTP